MIDLILYYTVLIFSISAPFLSYFLLNKLNKGFIKDLLNYLYYAFIFFCIVYASRSITVIIELSGDFFIFLCLIFNFIGVIIGLFASYKFYVYAKALSFKPKKK